jgi:hypothetical protein
MTPDVSVFGEAGLCSTASLPHSPNIEALRRKEQDRTTRPTA